MLLRRPVFIAPDEVPEPLREHAAWDSDCLHDKPASPSPGETGVALAVEAKPTLPDLERTEDGLKIRPVARWKNGDRHEFRLWPVPVFEGRRGRKFRACHHFSAVRIRT
jgi:hypothetical protein